jgi:ribonuclease R
MDIDQVKSEIVEFVHGHQNAPVTSSEIAKALKLRGKAAKKLQKWLHQLVIKGDIVRIRDNRFGIGDQADLVTGKLDVARSGNGFLTETGGPDVFLPEECLGTALPGDTVVVRLDTHPSGAPGARRSGVVIRILERSRKDVVGTLKSTGKFFYVVPIDPAYSKDFYVPDTKGAKVGDRVVIRFEGWQNRHVSPEAEVIEVIGPADKPSSDTISVVRHYGFKDEFPSGVMREVERVSHLMDVPGPRLDLREKYILTIDPFTARDFDDALSLEKDASGNRVLGVHIADVGHFVRKGSVTDLEARERGNSVYLGDKVIPMLPEQLSNGLCSLRPNEDRLTFSVFMTVDGSGRVINRSFAKTIIRSKLRLTYEQAFSLLRQGPQKGRASAGKNVGELTVPERAVIILRDLNTLAQQFRAKRFANHALDLDVPECEVIIGPDGYMEGIRIVPNDVSHQLVEECMVAANEAVAAEVSHRGLAGIYRIHEPPRRDKIEMLTAELSDMGLRPGDLSHRSNLSAFLKSVVNNPLGYHIRVAVLRSINRAVYSEKAEGHYGLAKKYYGHFTSPIRRYPDLVLHRQLAHLLSSGRLGSGLQGDEAEPWSPSEPHRKASERPPYDAAEISAISGHASRTEQTADEAERALLEIKKYRYLEQNMRGKKPRAYEAVVVKVMNFGMFIEIMDIQLQGLVHISDISDKFVRFHKVRRSLEAGKTVYRLGSRVRVIVTGIDFDKRRIDFKLA